MRLGELIRGRDTEPSHALDPAHAEHERRVREARIEAARRDPNWTEVSPATRLVARGRYLVDADTDAVFAVRRGPVFERGSATVRYTPPNTVLTYTVNQADEIVFLDTPFGTRTWSEIVARKARR